MTSCRAAPRASPWASASPSSSPTTTGRAGCRGCWSRWRRRPSRPPRCWWSTTARPTARRSSPRGTTACACCGWSATAASRAPPTPALAAVAPRRSRSSTPTSCSRRTGSSGRSARWARRGAAVATKMVDLDDPAILYSAGDVLRRDGVCEQRGRFERDRGALRRAGRGLLGLRRARRSTGARRCWAAGGLRRAARHVPRGRRARAAAAAGGLGLPLGAARGGAARGRRVERRATGRAESSATRCCSSRATSASAGCRWSPTASSGGRGTRRATGGCASTWRACGWRCRCCAAFLRERGGASPLIDEVIPRAADPRAPRRRPPVAARRA